MASGLSIIIIIILPGGGLHHGPGQAAQPPVPAVLEEEETGAVYPGPGRRYPSILGFGIWFWVNSIHLLLLGGIGNFIMVTVTSYVVSPTLLSGTDYP